MLVPWFNFFRYNVISIFRYFDIARKSTQFCTELLGEVLDEFLHDGIDGAVVESLGLVLQDEVDGIGLLAGRQVLALIDIEEAHFAQELALGLVGDGLDLRELHALVDQQGEVAADGGELGQFGEADGLLADELHDLSPGDVGEVHFRGDVESSLQTLGDDAELCDDLAAAILDEDALGEEVVLAVLEDDGSEGYTQPLEDIHDLSLEDIEGLVLVGMCPRSADALAGDPEAKVVVLGVGIEHVLDDFGIAAAADAGDDVGTLLLSVEIVAVAELEELEVGATAVDVAADGLEATEDQGLAQHAEILREGIQQAHAVGGGVALEVVVI